MRFAFFGDIVGRAGRRAVKEYLPALRRDLKLDAVVINSENAKLLLQNSLTLALMFLHLGIIVLIIHKVLRLLTTKHAFYVHVIIRLELFQAVGQGFTKSVILICW